MFLNTSNSFDYFRVFGFFLSLLPLNVLVITRSWNIKNFTQSLNINITIVVIKRYFFKPVFCRSIELMLKITDNLFFILPEMPWIFLIWLMSISFVFILYLFGIIYVFTTYYTQDFPKIPAQNPQPLLFF